MSKAPLKTAPASMPIGQSCIVLDVRTDLEHAEIALKGDHHHIPLDKLAPRKFLQENKIDAERPVYVLCRSGKRATQAAESFIAAGHDNVHVIEGGIVACEAAGVPVRKKQVVSLERQVRIAAGTLVVLGVVSGATISPWFYGLAGFVGMGLVFAGITDSCAMGMLLAKAPWNKGDSAAPACGLSTTACQASVPAKEAPAIKVPAGTVFYSPAGAGATVTSQPAAKAKNSAGGCS